MPQSPIRQVSTQVRGAVLSHYEKVSKRVGLNPVPLLRQMGLSRSLLTTPTQLFPVIKAVQLLEISANESGCPTFGLLMAEERHLSDFGPISLLLMHQPSLRSALNTIMEYRHLLNESIAMFIEDAGKTTLIREEVVTGEASINRQATELALGALMLIFRAILGQTWSAKTIHFTHSAPADLQVYRRVFNCPVQFDSQFNGLVCLTSDLDRPNNQANAVMAKYAQSFMDAIPRNGQRSVVLEVRKSIYLLLPMGRANVDQISQGMGLNVRTLQRRLDENQVSFSNLINEVRCELAQRYVTDTNHSLSRVAEQLGYSNLSSFTRWFKFQFGLSPTQMRKNASGLLAI